MSTGLLIALACPPASPVRAEEPAPPRDTVDEARTPVVTPAPAEAPWVTLPDAPVAPPAASAATRPAAAPHPPAATPPPAPIAEPAPPPPSGPADDLYLAGGLSLAGGYFLGIMPIVVNLCGEEDTEAECDDKHERMSELDGALLWNLLPVGGPWIVVASSDDTFSRVWSGITGSAQLAGIALLVAGSIVDSSAEPEPQASGPRLETGALTVLSDGARSVPALVLSGRF